MDFFFMKRKKHLILFEVHFLHTQLTYDNDMESSKVGK